MELNILTSEGDVERAQELAAGTSPILFPDSGLPAPAEAPKDNDIDDWYGRLLKFTPAPVVGAYLAIQNIVKSVQLSRGWQIATLAIILLLLLGLVFLFYRRRGVVRHSQIALSLVAFAVWAIGITFPHWITSIAIILMAAFLVALNISPLPSE